MLGIFRRCHECHKYRHILLPHKCGKISIYRICPMCQGHFEIDWIKTHKMGCGKLF